MPSNPLILCHPFSSCLQSFPVLVFSSELALRIRWPKCWSVGFRISPPSAYSGLISFRMDWLALLAVQGTLKSLPQHQFESISSLALCLLYGPTLTSVLDYWKSFDYMDLCWQSDVSDFNTLFWFVITFLPRSKRLWLSRLQSPSAAILEPKEISLLSPYSCLFAVRWWDRRPWS